MKSIIHTSVGALLVLASLPLAPTLYSQTVEATETTVTSQGTVSEFGPQGVAITTEPGRTPVRYLSKETTNYVDESGLPVDPRAVVPGNPVTVHYTKVGDTLVASKVVVRSLKAGSAAAAVTTTTRSDAPPPVAQVESTSTIATGTAPPPTEIIHTTRTEGTVNGVGDEEMMVQTTSSRTPSRYFLTPTTTYTDEAGVAVSVEAVKSGLPVTVYYTDTGGVHRASKVVVKHLGTMTSSPSVMRTTVTAPAPAPVSESTTVVRSEPPVVKTPVTEREPSKVVVRNEEDGDRPRVAKKKVVESEVPATRKRKVEPEPESEQPRKRVVSTESTQVKKEAPPPGVIYKKTTTTTTTRAVPED
ncbi:MAG: hypothetical protein JWO89_155 [Verrucomicrobiaceae bacterium]|nr:hypothetical protein [Verrucomicrobiaceae bacterium]